MLTQTHRDERDKAPSAQAQAAPAGAEVQKKAALRGADFDAQVQMLKPDSQSGGAPGGGPAQEGGKGRGFLDKVKGAAKLAGDMLSNPKDAVYDARLGREGRQEQVLGDGHEIANADIVMEQLAHQGAYGRLDQKKLAAWGYREAGAAVDPESGFRAVLYMPTDEALAGVTKQGKTAQMIHGGKPQPVLAFRGTAEKRGMQDDTNRHGIGTYQFASNEGRVREMLGLAGGKCIVVGHSLGGALAQLAASHFPSSIARVVTFQSPGIPAEEAKKVDDHNKKAKPEDQIKSTHHRAEGDLVHMAGEALTDGDVFTHESVGIGNAMDHMSFPLARLAAARGDIIPGVNDERLGKKGGDRLVSIDKTSAKDEKSGGMAKLSEGTRKLMGGVVRDESMERYTAMWAQVKQMIDAGIFPKSQILGVIDIAKDLRPEQKIKMRDQALKLLGDRK